MSTSASTSNATTLYSYIIDTFESEEILRSLAPEGVFTVVTPIQFNYPVLFNPSPEENNLSRYIPLPPLFVNYTHDSTEVYVFKEFDNSIWTSFHHDLSWCKDVVRRDPFPLKHWIQERLIVHHKAYGIPKKVLYKSFASLHPSPIDSLAPNVPAVIINPRTNVNKMRAFIPLPPCHFRLTSRSVKIDICPTFGISCDDKPSIHPLDHEWLNFDAYYKLKAHISRSRPHSNDSINFDPIVDVTSLTDSETSETISADKVKYAPLTPSPSCHSDCDTNL